MIAERAAMPDIETQHVNKMLFEIKPQLYWTIDIDVIPTLVQSSILYDECYLD